MKIDRNKNNLSAPYASERIAQKRKNYDNTCMFGSQEVAARKKQHCCKDKSGGIPCYDHVRPRQCVKFVDSSKNVSFPDPYSQQERQCLYYSSEELKAITTDNYKIISLLWQYQDQSSSYITGNSTNRSTELCVRGLERYMMPQIERRRRRLNIRKIVEAQYFLKQQQIQQKNDQIEQKESCGQALHQQYCLAMFSWSLSKEDFLQARDRAIQDEKLLQAIIL